MVYAVITYQQWCQARLANEIAKANLEQTRVLAETSLKETTKATEVAERAWMTAQPLVPPTLTGKDPTVIKIVFRNTGKTPARLVDSRFEAESFPADRPFPADPPYPEIQRAPSRAVFPPNFPLEIALPVKPTAAALAVRGTHTLYAYGRLTYLDIFEKERHITFCIYYETGRAVWNLCPTYNDAD